MLYLAFEGTETSSWIDVRVEGKLLFEEGLVTSYVGCLRPSFGFCEEWTGLGVLHQIV